MDLVIFSTREELNLYLKAKIRQKENTHVLESILADIAESVLVDKNEIERFILADVKSEEVSHTVLVPILCHFHTPFQVKFMIKKLFPSISAAFERANENVDFIRYPQRILQPIHSEISAHIEICKQVPIDELYQKFGKTMTDDAVQALLDSKIIKRQDNMLISDEGTWYWPSPNAITALIRADLDILPLLNKDSKYSKFFGLTRHSKNINEATLPDIKSLFIKFNKDFFDLVERDQHLPKNVQINMDNLYYVRSPENDLKPIYRVEQEQIESMTKLTQMFAHDARKPFTMIQTLLQFLENLDDVEQIKAVISKYSPEVTRSLQNVNTMIEDIMGMGREIDLHLENIDPVTLIDQTFKDLFRFQDKANIDLDCQFNHHYAIKGDWIKLLRVTQNIIQNAIQAMNYHGKIWILTKEIVKSNQIWLQFCIGNNNSYIPPSELTKLFEAFYSNNKKNGTGLGLAIVHKIIVAHQGEVWCQSLKEVGVEFYFTLPIGEPNTKGKVNIPKNSKNYLDNVQAISKVAKAFNPMLENTNFSPQEKASDHIIKKSKNIVVVDDEAIILEYWHRLSPYHQCFLSPEQFFHHLEDGKLSFQDIDALVIDFYFEDSDSSFDGFSFAKKLRAMNYTKPIYLATNVDKDLLLDAESKGITKIICKNPKMAFAEIQDNL